ncbi:MAG: response regulator transcription factor [Clostridiales Family XIII bacterium]|jgi:DNA-binding response OmpR family regulator|nr:response regulator transcription factor [Clostridiales Family XIII bacterium]
MRTILIIEDEANIRDILSRSLSGEGFSCTEAEDGTVGLRKATAHDYDLILLDLMLPGMDGLEVLQGLRREGVMTPVIILTAKSDEADKVIGLGFGADDYITKPFGLKEISARVKAVIRRNELSQAPPSPEGAVRGIMKVGALEINVGRHDVRMAGEPILLTLKEFELLRVLAENRGHVLTRTQLLDKVWGYEYSGETRTVDVHVRYLRRKLGEGVITTIRGFGYKLE